MVELSNVLTPSILLAAFVESSDFAARGRIFITLFSYGRYIWSNFKVPLISKIDFRRAPLKHFLV